MVDQMSASCGIVYVATGEKYIQEAIQSAESAQPYEIETAIFCDQPDLTEGLFDYVFRLESPGYGVKDKINPLKKAPFEKNLFLDTDTFLLEDISEIFELLEKYDICYSHAPVRRNGVYVNEEIPKSFVQPNTGVVLYERNKKTKSLFKKWKKIYEKKLPGENPPDQPAFREALWKTDLNTYVLPAEYNLRSRFEYFIGGRSSVKILHGRGNEVEEKRSIESLSTGFSPVVSPIEETAVDLYHKVGHRKILRAMFAGLKEKIYSRG